MMAAGWPMAGLVGQIQKVPDFPSRVSEASEAGEKFVESSMTRLTREDRCSVTMF